MHVVNHVVYSVEFDIDSRTVLHLDIAEENSAGLGSRGGRWSGHLTNGGLFHVFAEIGKICNIYFLILQSLI